MIEKIQQDLFDFIDADPDELEGLIYFWYTRNSPALAATLEKEKGVKLLVNIDNFNHFEVISKKLFLLADTIVLRDNRKYTNDERLNGFYPVPTGEYKPGYMDELFKELEKLTVPPLTITDQVNGFWTSDNKVLNNGYHVAYAMQNSNLIPKYFTDWITSSGREYLNTGSIIYAPFIPPIEWELEFLKQNISLPSSFDLTPCFHQKMSWFTDDNLKSLISLNFPFLDKIDVSTLQKIKEDNYDTFKNFSDTMTSSIDKIKSEFGTPEFIKEVQYIQRNEIDDKLDKVNQKLSSVIQMQSLRKQGIALGALTLNASMLLGASTTGLVSGASATIIAMIMEKVKEMKDTEEIKSNSSYFLYQLGNGIIK